ncbi:hypothetical protein M569_05746, partial [Genlisea aurea]
IKKTPKTEAKTILKQVAGVVFPGEMLAMLGPSGSGKTTLLTALGGRLSGGTIAGKITYNDKPFCNSIKRNTGFVTQDDVLYPHLTVTETLFYTALLRLPGNLTAAEKLSQAEEVITQLGLTKCRHSIVGGPLLRGISGGERKRVSIGQEMLINPGLLLLDEPTSGLDSTTAQRIVSLLKDLSGAGKTIVMTIHQPSSRIFYMFQKVLLLCDGNPLFFGKGSDSLNYFSGIGFSPAVAMNPADFFLDLANGYYTGDSSEDQTQVKDLLIKSYRTTLQSTVRKELAGESQLLLHHHHLHVNLSDKKKRSWSNSWCQQFSVLFRRGMKERKHEYFSGFRIFQVIAIAVLSGLLWWNSHDLEDQVGLLFFTSGFWGFYPLFQAIFIFPKEKMMLKKERSSGMYRLSSYFMALNLSDLPMQLVLPTAFFAVIYFMSGLRPSPAAFFSALSVLLFSVLVSHSLGLAIGAAVMDEKSATMMGTVIMLGFLLAGGYYVRHVAGFVSWIKYVSISHYTYKLLIGAQFEGGERYDCGGRVCFVRDFPMVKAVGLGGSGWSVGAMVIMLVVYSVVAYLALMRIGVTRR